ncbi:MAG: hypothetical protein JXM73_25370 [Anaerolineae bacterium]|nr:hypothetical protein [Anaerolineae bacterium]
MGNLKVVLVSMGILILGLGVAFVAFLLSDQEAAAAAVGTLCVAIFLVFSHVLAFAAGAHYTKGSMILGAEVALRAHESSDRRDERQTVTLGKMFTEGVRIARQATGAQPDAAPLLMPPSAEIEEWLTSAAYQTFDMDAD